MRIPTQQPTGHTVHRLLLILPLLFACSTTSYNDTVFPYEINPELESGNAIKTVLIAPVNLGKPSRKFLQEHQGLIDSQVAKHLRKHGLKIKSSREFEQRWREAIRKYGNVYDPTSNKINEQAAQLSHAYVLNDLKQSSDIDVVIYTDLISREVFFSANSHKARWDGVSRKLPIEGTGAGVPSDFNWNQPVEAVSLMVTAYRLEDLKLVFRSIGGIETTDALSLRDNPRFKRRRHVLDNELYIQEGIALAFHPWVPMENYPGKK
jgi:hypothetical protein